MKIKILTKYRFVLAILASLIVIIAFGWGFLTKTLLSLMLNPQLPKGFSLLVQSAEKRNGYPCLDVFQQNSNELVSSSHFCLNSGQLLLLNQSLKEIKL